MLGPRLKTFRWDFTKANDNYNSGSWKHFGIHEMSWLKQLAQAAVTRASALEKIEIMFQPALLALDADTIYPWDGLDDIRDEILRPSGRELTYDEPPCSKVEWHRYKVEGLTGGWFDHLYDEDAWSGCYDGMWEPMEIAADEPSQGWSDTDDQESEYDESGTDEEKQEDDGVPTKWMKYQGEDIRNYFKPKEKTT